jgi:hypothetical protein
VVGSSSITRIFSDIRLASGTNGFLAGGGKKSVCRIEQRDGGRRNGDEVRVEWVKAERRCGDTPGRVPPHFDERVEEQISRFAESRRLRYE